MIVPTANDILKDKLPLFAPEVNQQELIAQMKEALPGFIDVTDVLSAHKEEDIFYKTDHHWTSLGVYLSLIHILDHILSNLHAILSNSLFGITLTIAGYLIGLWLNRKFKTPILNPLLIAMVLIIPILYFCRIPYDAYNKGGNIITV